MIQDSHVGLRKSHICLFAFAASICASIEPLRGACFLVKNVVVIKRFLEPLRERLRQPADALWDEKALTEEGKEHEEKYIDTARSSSCAVCGNACAGNGVGKGTRLCLAE